MIWILAGSVLHLNRKYVVDQRKYGPCCDEGPKVPDDLFSKEWGTFGELFCYLALGLWGYHDELKTGSAYGQSYRMAELFPGVAPSELVDVKIPELPGFVSEPDSGACPKGYLINPASCAYLDSLVHMAVQKDGAKKSAASKTEAVEPFYHRMLQLYSRAFDRTRLKDKLSAMTVLLKKGKDTSRGLGDAGPGSTVGGPPPAEEGLDED
jgi:hypothetical protein